MHRLSVKTVFLVCLFVGYVQTRPEGGLNTTVANVPSAYNVTNATINNTTEVHQSDVKTNKIVEGEPVKPNKTEASTIATPPLTLNESIPIEKKDGQEKQGENCNYQKETLDMTKCRASPHDDDIDEIVDPTQHLPIPVATKEYTTDKTVLSQSNITLNTTFYNTAPPETDGSKNANTTAIPNDEPQFNHTEIVISSDVPLAVDNIRNLNPENHADIKKPVNDNDNSMPSGLIALVTAVTFALAIVFAYVIMIAWRRYVEYKYGHRELLVNDLEFDTNDLRHFEL